MRTTAPSSETLAPEIEPTERPSPPAPFPPAWTLWGLAAVGALLYLAAFRTWFYTDDFTWIWWTDHQSWREALFSTHVYAYYRPLHCALFKGLYSLFGLRAGPFVAASLLLHFLHLGLLGLLLRRVFRDARLVCLALVLYATSPLYENVITWKSNYSAQLSSVFILAALLFQLRWMAAPARWGAAAGLLVMATAAFLSKQQGIQIVLFYPLAALAFAWTGQARATARQTLGLYLALAALCGAYALHDRTAMVQAYPWFTVQEHSQPPRQILACGMNLLSSELLFLRAWNSPLALPVANAGRLLTHAQWLPLALGALIWWKGNAAERFGWTFALLNLFPALLILNMAESRVHYLGLIGYALLWASLGLRLWYWSWRSRGGRWARMALLALVAYVLINNVCALQMQCLAVGDRAAPRRQLFQALAGLPANALSPGSGILFPDMPFEEFPFGSGLFEFVRLARHDDTLTAFNLTPMSPLIYTIAPPRLVAERRQGRLLLRPLTADDRQAAGPWWRWKQ